VLLSELDHHLGGSNMMDKERLLSIPEDQLFTHLPEEWSRNGRKFKSLNRHRQ